VQKFHTFAWPAGEFILGERFAPAALGMAANGK
jgi:hypothetical protein